MRRAVIFDLDGTLLDSFSEGLRRVKIISELSGIKFTENVEKNLVSFWGMPGVELLEKSFGVPRHVARDLYKKWEIWDELDPIQLVPGALDTLEEISMNCCLIILLTSRNTENAIRILKLANISRFFDIVVGFNGDKRSGIRVEHKKPSPLVFDPILAYINEEDNLKRSDCVFIGDTVIDAKCGVGAGIKTVAVLTGPATKEEFLEAGVREKNILPSVASFSDWLRFH